MGPSWYVLRIEPKGEYLSAAELARDGFEIFFPRVNSPHHRIGHTDEPLFPGYLFVRFDPESMSWPSFRPAHRVVGWVSFGGFFPTVPDETITELNRRIGALNAGDGLWRRYKIGEKVRVVSGNIDSLAKVMEEAKSPQGRARVIMEFMGQQVSALVPWGDIQPVQDQPNERQTAPRRTRGRSRWIRGFGPAAVAQT